MIPNDFETVMAVLELLYKARTHHELDEIGRAVNHDASKTGFSEHDNEIIKVVGTVKRRYALIEVDPTAEPMPVDRSKGKAKRKKAELKEPMKLKPAEIRGEW